MASFLDPVDDASQIRKSLPWPPQEDTERQLAELDREEAELIARRSFEGAQFATNHGLAATPLAIEAHGPVWPRLLDSAATSAASCVVVGHRAPGRCWTSQHGVPACAPLGPACPRGTEPLCVEVTTAGLHANRAARSADRMPEVR